MFRIVVEEVDVHENGRRIINSVRLEPFTKVSELIEWCRRREGEEEEERIQMKDKEERRQAQEELYRIYGKDIHIVCPWSPMVPIFLTFARMVVGKRQSRSREEEQRQRQCETEELLLVALYSYFCILWVNLYLFGFVDTSGTQPYNSGALEFRATYVSLLLFLGSYIWIKFRDVANASRERYVLRRNKRSSSGKEYSKYEPRYTPPGERNWLPLRSYDTERDAEVVLQIAKFYYDEAKRAVDLGEGSQFYIPSISESERNLSAHSKWEWVRRKAREVLEEYQKEKAANSTDDLPDIQDILGGRTIVEEDTNLLQPNLRNGQLKAEQPQPPPHIQQPLEGQYFESLLENLDLFEKNKRLKSRFNQVRQLLGVPTLQPPLRADDEESMTQHSLEEHNSLLLLENQRLEAILENTRSTMERTMGNDHGNSSFLVSDGKKYW